MNIENAQKYYDELIECDENHIEKAMMLFEKMEVIYRTTPSEELAELMAESLFNLAYYTSYMGDDKKAFFFLDALDGVGKEYPTNQTIVWNLVHCYSNLINSISEDDILKAFSLFELLKGWYIEYPKNEDIVDRLGDACYNLMIELSDTNRVKTHALLSLLKELQSLEMKNDKMCTNFMYASYNYVYFFGTDMTTDALEVFYNMKDISDKFIDDIGLVYESVKAASFLIEQLIPNEIQLALELFEMIHMYANKHKDDEDIAYYTIVNAYNFIVKLKDTDMNKCRELYAVMLKFEEVCDDEVESMLDVLSLVLNT